MRILVGPTDKETDDVFNGMTPQLALRWSIKHKLMDYFKKSIDRGADINSVDKIGHTPLMLASFFNNIEVVKLIVENGADVNIKDLNGWTALMFAVNRGKLEIIKYLVEKGADVNIVDRYGDTPITIATRISYDYPGVIKFLQTFYNTE
jgi:ankyrin repeat protein